MPTLIIAANIKRKRDRSQSPAARPSAIKRPKVSANPKAKADAVLNSAPTERLHIYVCGAGSGGELGLGAKSNAIDVTRPRLNANLAADTVGVVSLACGGMHCVALTHDNKILTWGVNDTGALGRPTPPYEGKMVEADGSDSDSEDEAEESGLNPLEATPDVVSADHFPDGTIFTQAAASDSASFVLTDDGLVYGWGLFRDAAGDFGFSVNADGSVNEAQPTPTLIQDLKNIISIDAGGDHVVALDKSGQVYAWGPGANGQIGRRPMERRKFDSLKPGHVALPKNKIASIHCGANHSFAITKNGEVYSWGLNNRGQCGVPETNWDGDCVIFKPQKIKSFTKPIRTVAGGNKQSVACTHDGEALTFGMCSVGLAGTKNLPTDDDMVVKNERGEAEILLKPLKVDAISTKTFLVAAGSEQDIAVTEDGKIYTWGFNGSYALGVGPTDNDDVYEPMLVANTAVKDKKIVWAGSGGQFSVFASVA